MSLFYLVNHKDEDIRRYSWGTISQTISIFVAVLMFQGFNGVVERELEAHHIHLRVTVDVLQVLVWIIALQITVGIISGALGEGSEIGGSLTREQIVRIFGRATGLLFWPDDDAKFVRSHFGVTFGVTLESPLTPLWSHLRAISVP